MQKILNLHYFKQPPKFTVALSDFISASSSLVATFIFLAKLQVSSFLKWENHGRKKIIISLFLCKCFIEVNMHMDKCLSDSYIVLWIFKKWAQPCNWHTDYFKRGSISYWELFLTPFSNTQKNLLSWPLLLPSSFFNFI